MQPEILILRELASRYFEAACSSRNLENIARHKRVNDLQGDRPILLIDEIPWEEMQIGDELTLRCSNPVLRDVEWYLRTNLYKWTHMPADMVLTPYIGVQKIIRSTGIGVARTDQEYKNDTLSHIFVNQLEEESDLEKLHNEVISYDEAATRRKFEIVANTLGDILPVKITGEPTGYGLGCKTMDDVVTFCGLDTFFYDLIDRPEFMHAMIGKLTDIFLNKIDQYNQLGLFDGDAYYVHSTAALTNDLHPNHLHTTSDGVWGRGLAQIFGSVSPDMHDEFDTQYMIRAMKPFGLVYYGCCEPLDQKINILEQIPNLRKISITPWANVDHAAEIMQNRYVMASKPTPSAVAVPTLDEDAVRQELTRIVSAIRRNSCSADIVLKDISTVCRKPETLFRWHDIAMEVIQSI